MSTLTTEHNDMKVDGYDRSLIPSETKARREREGDRYKTLPDNPDAMKTRDGFTVDNEGLLNNYAIEPDTGKPVYKFKHQDFNK